MSTVTSISRPDPYARFDEILRRGTSVVEKKLTAREATPTVANAPQAADEIDQAYGHAMNGIDNSQKAMTQHELDADRVAQLLSL